MLKTPDAQHHLRPTKTQPPGRGPAISSFPRSPNDSKSGSLWPPGPGSDKNEQSRRVKPICRQLVLTNFTLSTFPETYFSFEAGKWCQCNLLIFSILATDSKILKKKNQNKTSVSQVNQICTPSITPGMPVMTSEPNDHMSLIFQFYDFLVGLMINSRTQASFIFIYLFLATPCGLGDLNSPTRD